MAFDAAAGLPLPEATAALDGIVRQGLVDLAIEYDGRWHEGDLQRALDDGRLAALRAAGWTVIVVTAELLRDHRRLVVAVSAAVAERQALQP
jgi:very-short-patch-repair endonuclease